MQFRNVVIQWTCGKHLVGLGHRLMQWSQYVVTVYSKAQTHHGQNDEWPLQYCHLRATVECKTRGRERKAFALRMSATEEVLQQSMGREHVSAGNEVSCVNSLPTQSEIAHY